jgi:chemotaxis protein CheD
VGSLRALGLFFWTPFRGRALRPVYYGPVARAGGMNHFLLPDGANANDPTSARYGINAMELLINELLKLNVQRRRIQAKIFGAGHVLKIRESLDGVPQRNIDFIRRFLDTERIPIVTEDLGGYRSRRVLFSAQSGVAYMRYLDGAYAARTADEELAYLEKMRARKLDGDAILF